MSRLPAANPGNCLVPGPLPRADLSGPDQQKCDEVLDVVDRNGEAQHTTVERGRLDEQLHAILRRLSPERVHDRVLEPDLIHRRILV
jgi:hypothetical protein